MPAEGASRPESSPFYVKPTYLALSQAIDGAIRHIGNLKEANAFEHLKDQLFLSPRLTQWREFGSVAKGREFRIDNIMGTVSVSVFTDKVRLTKDADEYPVISDPALATTLFKALEDAQAFIQPYGTKSMTAEEQESFFTPTDEDYYEGAGLDPALEETHSDALVEEDAELMARRAVLAGGVSANLFQIAVEDSPSWPFEPPDEAKAYVGKNNDYVEVEVAKLKKEYLELKTGEKCPNCGNYSSAVYEGSCPQCPKDRPEKDCPRIETTRVVAHLKSLQGQILNIVEAAIADKEQRKAVKTLINKTFRGKMNNLGAGRSSDDEE